MAKKSGLFSLLVGTVAGATAVFLSDEKNRQKTKKELTKAAKTAQTFKKKLDEDPDVVMEEVVTNAKALVKTQFNKIKTKVAQFQATQTTPKIKKPAGKKSST